MGSTISFFQYWGQCNNTVSQFHLLGCMDVFHISTYCILLIITGKFLNVLKLKILAKGRVNKLCAINELWGYMRVVLRLWRLGGDWTTSGKCRAKLSWITSWNKQNFTESHAGFWGTPEKVWEPLSYAEYFATLRQVSAPAYFAFAEFWLSILHAHKPGNYNLQ